MEVFRKWRVFWARVRSMSFRRMGMYARQIGKETGRARPLILLDMLWCAARYRIGYLDYRVFGFCGKPARVRKTYMTMEHNLALSRRMNDTAAVRVFQDKALFNQRFADFLGRGWIDLRQAGEAGLRAFCAGKDAVFAKQTESFGGQGIVRVPLVPPPDFAALYSRLTGEKQWLVEEAIRQHPEMDRLCESSINTVRIVTLWPPGGEPQMVYALVRMGNGRGCVDNISSGGLYTQVSGAGVLTAPAFCDKTGEYYERHPATGTVIPGFRIPCFEQAVALCQKAARVEPRVRYVGWDVAITPEGPVLVEGNELPGYDMCQNAGQVECGILPRFREILGKAD